MKTNKIYCECGGLMNQINNHIIKCEECHSTVEINIDENKILEESV